MISWIRIHTHVGNARGFIPHHNHGAGFTLLELLVSVAIISILSIVMSQVFISTIRTNTKTEILKEVKQNGDSAIESMVRMIQNAQIVTCNTTRSLAIVNPDGFTTTLACLADGTAMRLASSSASTTVYLSSKKVTLGGVSCDTSTLLFTCTSATGMPSSVMISFRLAQTGAPGAQFETASETFQTTAAMRNNSL